MQGTASMGFGARRSKLLGWGMEGWSVQVKRVENKHLKEACCPPFVISPFSLFISEEASGLV